MAGPNYGLLDNALVNKNRAVEGYGAVNALVAQNLQNQADKMAIENAMAEKAAGQAAEGDINAFQQNLMRLGRPKEAVAVGKAAAEIGKLDTEAVNTRLKSAASLSTMANTPSEMAALMRAEFNDPYLGKFYTQMGLTPDKAEAMLAESSKTPEAFRQFKMSRVMGLEKMYDQLNAEGQLKVSQRNADIAAGHLGVARQNQNLAERRFAAEQAEKGPLGKEMQDVQANRKALKTAGYDPETGEDKVSELIKKSTSGRAEAWSAAVPGFFGYSTSGMEAIKELETYSNKMALDLLNGKLGAGISNEDRKFILAGLGDVANPDVPADARQAAWKQVVERMRTTGMIEPPKGKSDKSGTSSIRQQADAIISGSK